MTIRTSISKRDRKRTLTCGAVILQPRYVLNFNDPRTGKRRQLFFRSQREAIARRDSILAAIATNSYSELRSQMTVGGAVEHWLENRRMEVKASTWKTYRQISTNCIIGPLLVGTPGERKTYREEGSKPDGTYFVEALGHVKVCDLTTGDIRRWHRTLLAEVGSRSANMSKTLLQAALSLAAEDFSVRPPPMPSKLGRGRTKPKRTLLTSVQVGVLLKAAREDRARGIYYAWPFLTGTRPSEQLGVLWEDIDLEKGVVLIRRMQERDGKLSETTKTASGAREIPLAPLLREMLVAWRSICPRHNRELHRAFPGPQGGCLTYWNWRARYFRPALIRLGLPVVTPHSARHGFISGLQANGIEVGLVAKLAGHANPSTTLTHYTRALRTGDKAILALESYLTGEGQ